MGLHYMYEDEKHGKRKKCEPTKERNWVVEYIDPDTNKIDRKEYTCEEHAKEEVESLKSIGITAVIVKR